MKKLKLVYLLFFLLLNIVFSIAFNASAQGQSISLKMKRPPLNQLSVADLYNIELTNNTNERIEFYLYGTLSESKAGLIATATTVSIMLGPKERKQFKASDLPGTPDISYPNTDNRYKEALMRKGSLPDGNYTICVYARQTGTNDELANDCIEQEITIQSEAEISLLTPDDKIQIGTDESVSFTWVVLGEKSGGPYKIKIVELKGDESPENAILKNKAFFEKEGIRSTTFQYPSSAPKLEAGKSYAWMVSTGKINSRVNVFQKSGGSGTPTVASLTPFCTTFEDGTTGGWQPNNIITTVQSTGGNPGGFIETTDQSGASYFFNTDSTYIGDWGDLMTDSCGSLCFDIKFIYQGNVFNGTSPPLTMQPSITIESGTFIASFVPWNTITVGDGWHSYCAPLKYLNSDGTLPSNSDGRWIISAGTASDWNTILGNVTRVRLPCDPSSYQSERIGYDNICIKNTGDCVPSTGNSGNPCDSLLVTAQADSGNCCWSINLINNQSALGINGVQFLTQAPITFSGYPAVPSNNQWQYQTSSPLDLSLVNITGGYLTQGQSNNFINFCLNNYTTSPQLVIVNWKHNDSIVCTDTLKLNCQKDCMELNVDSVYCYNDGYNINFSFLNQSGFDIHTLELTPVTSNTTIAPAVITLSPDIAAGNNSGIQTIFAASTDDVNEICFVVKAIGPENCCFCIDTICVPVQSCVCSDIDASISGSGPGCCWDVTLNNNYLPNYFTGVSLNILTSGVTFAGTITAPTGWMLNNASPFTTLRYKPLPWTNGGKIPAGATSPLHFCLAGYTSAPTVIVLNWLAGQNGDSVVCTDTLEVTCTPDPINNGCLGIFNDSLWCNADGTFGYEFQVFNAIYGFTAEGFALSPLPAGSAAFNPAVFPGLNLPPLTNSGVLSSAISGINSGEELCFRTTMYDSIFSEHDQTWSTLCCHFDTCYTMPDCGTVIIDSCDCEGGRWNSSTIGVSINGSVSKYSCGEQITANLNSSINLDFPTFTCNPASCPAEYRWELSDVSGNIQSTGNTNPFNPTFNTPGNYIISYIASCNGNACDTCTLRVIIKDDGGDNCKCDEKASFDVSYGPGLKEKVTCGKTISAKYGANLTFNPNSLCIPKDCLTGYAYEIFDMQTNVFISGQNISGNNPFTFALNSSAGYTIKITYNCGGKRCECIVYIRTKPVEQGCDCKRGKWDLSKSAIKYTVDGKPNEKRIKCDGNYEIDGNTTVSLSPEYNCGQANCNAKYTYKVNNGAMTGFQSSPYNISNINSPSSIMIYAWCGEKICDSCTIYLKPRINTDCKCGGWERDTRGFTINGSDISSGKEIKEFLKCDGIYKSITRGTYLDLVSQTYLCNSRDCRASYEWVITSQSGTTASFGTQTINDYQFNQKGVYTIYLRTFCGGVACGECKMQIEVKAHPNDPK